MAPPNAATATATAAASTATANATVKWNAATQAQNNTQMQLRMLLLPVSLLVLHLRARLITPNGKAAGKEEEWAKEKAAAQARSLSSERLQQRVATPRPSAIRPELRSSISLADDERPTFVQAPEAEAAWEEAETPEPATTRFIQVGRCWEPSPTLSKTLANVASCSTPEDSWLVTGPAATRDCRMVELLKEEVDSLRTKLAAYVEQADQNETLRRQNRTLQSENEKAHEAHRGALAEVHLQLRGLCDHAENNRMSAELLRRHLLRVVTDLESKVNSPPPCKGVKWHSPVAGKVRVSYAPSPVYVRTTSNKPSAPTAAANDEENFQPNVKAGTRTRRRSQSPGPVAVPRLPLSQLQHSVNTGNAPKPGNGDKKVGTKSTTPRPRPSSAPKLRTQSRSRDASPHSSGAHLRSGTFSKKQQPAGHPVTSKKTTHGSAGLRC